MRLLASQLRDITNAIKSCDEDKYLTNILKTCLEDATMGRASANIDIDYTKLDKNTIQNIVARLRDFNFIIEVVFHDDYRYAELLVRW